jgi:ion channel
VTALRDEVRHIMRYEARHRRLLARLRLVVLATLVIDLVGASLIFGFECNVHGSEVHNYWDAFFFTTVQLLTVSSQLRNPVTTGGRIVDIALEVWAVIVVAGSAGAIASFFQDDPR